MYVTAHNMLFNVYKELVTVISYDPLFASVGHVVII